MQTPRPVSLDLSHVRHASDAEAEVLPVESFGDGAGDGGLAYTRWAVEAHDLPLGGAPQLAHGDEFLHKVWEICSFATSVLNLLLRKTGQ